jgi:hypothetical protein
VLVGYLQHGAPAYVHRRAGGLEAQERGV